MKFRSVWVLEVEAENIKQALDKNHTIYSDVFTSFNIQKKPDKILFGDNKHSWIDGEEFNKNANN